MSTPYDLGSIGQARVISNLRRSYAELQTVFRHHYMEAMQMRSWVLLYATCYDDDARKELDAALREEHPAIWGDIQEWRKNEGRL